ncbi:carbonic anhydrase [Dyadobacter bucti]|uniref:carbonic anhydrase n=1 Tax=Dyadobacter bucti TaxID=2572203 RepID=UPI003F6E46D3
MLHLALFCLRATLLPILIFGLLCCNSADKKTTTNTDSTIISTADSTTSLAEEDSTGLSFDMIIDSVYQHSPKNVFQSLMKGHRRFSKDSSFVYNSDNKIPDSLARIKPVLVMTDIDLGQSVEKIFDLRRSMLMQLSSPACLVDPKQIAVMEYAVNYSGTKVILVLSSSNSRIIGAAVDNVQTANFASIVNELLQATKSAPEFADRSSANKDFVNNIAQSQSRLTLEKILQSSPQIKMLADSGKVVLKSAFFDAGKRSVTILDREAPLNPSAKK